MLYVPVVIPNPASLPTAVLPKVPPVPVCADNALYPTAVQKLPVVSASRARYPIAVFPTPDVRAFPASYPIATLPFAAVVKLPLKEP